MEFKKSPSSSDPRRPEQKVSNDYQPAHREPLYRGPVNSKNTKSAIIAIVALVVILALLVGGAMMMRNKSSGMGGVKKDQYQAVFLTNGQVYFGKIDQMNKDHLKLTNIYYLQVQQSVQPEQKKSEDTQISLAKLGDELHGPEDAMHINKDQMLFWENLKDNGKVVEAIKSASQK